MELIVELIQQSIVNSSAMDMPLAHFDAIRKEEISRVLSAHGDIFTNRDVLEIGSGTGLQLRAIQKVARSVVGLELAGGIYVRDESIRVVEYDGLHIPFPDASFDVVFSSNVMEHIKQQEQINKEIRRVLRPGGKAVHVMPTRVWRVLTSVLHYPRLVKSALSRSSSPQVTRQDGPRPRTATRLKNILVPARHGDLGGWFAEYGYFGVSRWAEHFRKQGWKVEAYDPIGLAYSGNCLLADKISIHARSSISRLLGSSAAVFVVS
jgi:SAM-dependent methyltransferase